MAMQIERSRELAVLRANGLTPRQLWFLVSGETGLIGLIAGVLAIPLGVLQAMLLIHVINRRSFGWTMQTWIDPWILAQAVALAIVAAVLAGIYPALRMARTSPALALREE
jgi:putative ABC transport system permease protein